MTVQQSSDGRHWEPSVPEPFWVRRWVFWWRPLCWSCRTEWPNQAKYRAHYRESHSDRS